MSDTRYHKCSSQSPMHKTSKSIKTFTKQEAESWAEAKRNEDEIGMNYWAEPADAPMSETKLTRYRVPQGFSHQVLPEGHGYWDVLAPTDYYLSTDADARITDLERERDELRKRVEELETAVSIARAAIHEKSDIYLANEKIAPYNDDAHIDGITFSARECKIIDAALRTPPAAQGAQP